MLVTLYINELPVDTLKDRAIYVDVKKLWKTLKIKDYRVPVPDNLELITNGSDRSYTIGNYCTVSDTMAALEAVPLDAFDYPELGETMKRGLVEVLDRYWSAQSEFTPLY